MRIGWGGLGAWGMFAALVAVFALWFNPGHQKQTTDYQTTYTLEAEAPTMPLIVVSDSAAILAASPYTAGHTFAGLGLETKIYAQASTIDSGVSATVLILHRYAVKSRDRDDIGLKRNRHIRHRLM